MTRLGLVLAAMLGPASLMAPAPAAAQDTGVTGAAEAAFPNGAAFNGIPLKGLTLGQGMFIGQDGSATGQFQAVLLGTSLLGTPQNVTVEGEVSNGSVAVGGGGQAARRARGGGGARLGGGRPEGRPRGTSSARTAALGLARQARSRPRCPTAAPPHSHAQPA